ncbi:hypothetical protein HMPREF1869_01257 [Bacteroidales bacterium KA00251]|nr:hypothetical protein HMPREF1869_01257 [Bacteroidales bacterium KA00251]
MYKKVSEHPLKCVVINEEKNVDITFKKKELIGVGCLYYP